MSYGYGYPIGEPPRGFDILHRPPCKHGISKFSKCSRCAAEQPEEGPKE